MMSHDVDGEVLFTDMMAPGRFAYGRGAVVYEPES